MFCLQDALAALPPVISSFSPVTGPIGTTVTVTGGNFSTVASNNIIYFGGMRATVLSAATNSLMVTVPLGATAPLTVTVSNLTTAAAVPFTVTFNSTQVIDTNSFEPRVGFNGPLGSRGIVIGDWNGDGQPDLATVGTSVAKLSIYQNVSTGGVLNASSFGAKVDFSTGSSPRGVAMGDLDGDGKPDLVTANDGPDTVSVFRNTSTNGVINTSTYAPRVDFDVDSRPFSVAIADLDGDGKPDLVTANENGASVSVLHNTTTNGVISFAPRVDLPAGNSPRKVALADLDGDGRPDILVVNTTSALLSVFQNQITNNVISTNSFGPRVDFPIMSAWDVDVQDLDGDGLPDVVVSGGAAHTLSVFRNVHAGGVITTNSLAARIDFTVGSGSGDQGEAVIIDLDGDGKPDLAAASEASDSVYVFRNISTPGDLTTNSFAPAVIFKAGNGPFGITAGDVDGDGRPDIVVANFNGNQVSVLQSSIPIVPVAITTFSPTQGVGGTPVTLIGTNLDRAITVLLNDMIVDFAIVSSTQINLTVPVCSTPSGPFRVTTLGGVVTSSNSFTAITSSVVSGTNQYNLEAALCGGGVVTFAVDGTITVTNTEVISTDTTLDGAGHNVIISGGNTVGVFNVPAGVHLTLKNLTIANGRAVGAGGGLYNHGGTVTVDACTFINNAAVGGNNGGAGTGGAINNDSGGILTVNSTTFTGNSATGGIGSTGGNGATQFAAGGTGGGGGLGMGGGIYNADYGTVNMTNCTFYNNQASGGAGGWGGNGFNGYIHQFCCGLFCSQQCFETIHGGRGGDGGTGGNAYGGNCFNDSGDVLTVNVTFANGVVNGGSRGSPGFNGTFNTSGSGVPGSLGIGLDGNIAQGSGLLISKNCLFAYGTGGNLGGGTFADAGNNLSSDPTVPTNNASSFRSTNLNLGPLNTNGGPTLTLALLPGSAAIRTGTTTGAPATDQRGQPRKSLQIDIGAYETPVTPSGAPAVLVAATPFVGATPFKLTFTNLPGTSFSIWSASNLTLPFNDWTFTGFARETAPGQFQFSDQTSTNKTQNFYRVSSP